MTRLRNRLRSERGFTLIELLVATTIGTIVMLAAFSLVDAAVSGERRTQNRIDAVTRGRTAMEQVTRALRAQVCRDGDTKPLITATDNQVVFYSMLGKEPSTPSGRMLFQRRTLTYVPSGSRGSITENVVTGDTASPPNFTGAGTTRTIVSNIAPEPSTPIFRYYRFDDANAPATIQLSQPISDTNRDRVVRVRTTFRSYPENKASENEVATLLDSTIMVRGANANNPSGSPEC